MHLFHKPIMKQFRFVLYCLLALALLCYRTIDDLMMENARAYAANTAEKFNAEVEFLFERVDALSNSLLFDETIEKMLHAPYSEKTPEYLASLKSQFTSYSLMNRDLSEIALCSPTMTWSSFFDAQSLRQFSRELQGTYGSHCFGLYVSPLTAQKKEPTLRLLFGHNVYGMHNPTLYGQYLGCILLSIDPSRAAITLPEEAYPVEQLAPAIDDVLVMTLQYFINGCPTLCTHLVQEELSWDLFSQFGAVRDNPAKMKAWLHTLTQVNFSTILNIRTAFRLLNHIAMSPALKNSGDDEAYLYGFEQMAAEYLHLSDVLEEFGRLLKVEQAVQPPAETSSFLKILNYLEQNYPRDISLKTISQEFHLNSSYISQLIKNETG